MPQHRKYLVGKIHVGVRLADGTLLMPYAWDIPAEEGRPATSEAGMNLKSGALLSTDGGRTWKEARPPVPEGASKVQVTALTATPRLGAAATVALFIAGQLGASLLLDQRGWLGVPLQPITPTRLLGVACLVVGMVLIRWR